MASGSTRTPPASAGRSATPSGTGPDFSPGHDGRPRQAELPDPDQDGGPASGTGSALGRATVPLRRWARAAWGTWPVQVVVRLVTGTVSLCLRYRVTGLAAEAGFFALLSLPPLLLGLAGTAAYLGRELGVGTEFALQNGIRDWVSPFLTSEVVEGTLLPTLREAVDSPRFDLISVGFLLSLWSGSRALNVYVDTISIMYGLGGLRGIVRTRVLSFSLYLLTLALGALTIPLVLIGPSLVGRALPESVDWLLMLYWPVVTLMGVALLALLYHISTPVRTPWKRDLPGAALALVLWVVASFVLRALLTASVGGASIYGPLTAPIVVLIWLYTLAIAVLVGAALNAAADQLWPDPARSAARREAHPEDPPLTPVEDGQPPKSG